ncbi:MAG: cytochrome bc complex cytochrome b subunit [Gammaproteobacteria bacterium]|nr:MAG: cytochrome bc complex cytochrome b subunit [Gammaproteobacteria bacterium]
MTVKTATGAPARLPGGAAPKQGLWAWLNKRLPVDQFIHEQATGYYAPKNFNIWYFFGSLALFVLVMQLVTGIFLTMFYKPGELTAFDSVEYIMREVDFGWLIRYLHSTGASAFFIVVYLHMFRAFLYGSYRAPRELLWLIGMLVYLALMAEAFMGYVLPWGNMSFWGAQVIVNLFGTIPGIGTPLVQWIRGDYGIADATLNRFFALHVAAIPLALLLLVMLHLVALHQSGSNNPDGIEIKEKLGPDGKPLDGIPFHPYYTVKDLVGVGVFLLLFALVVFFKPTLGGLFLEAPNFEPANPLSTPEHIAPVWYFTPYYAILRAVPDQRMGALLMLLAVVSFLFLPWLDRSPVKSMRYRGWISRTALALFAGSFVALGYLGLQPAEGLYVVLARIFAAIYFAFFLLMPFYSRIDPVKPVPDRVVFHAH